MSTKPERVPDLTPPIIYVDEETGRVIRGGEDSPRADALRKELEEGMKVVRAEERVRMYYQNGGVIPRKIGPEPDNYHFPWDDKAVEKSE